MYKDLLPIGSVVALQGATRKLLIIGTIVHDEQTNTTYDYIGEPFPEGYIDAETMFLFQHEDIDSVHFLGYINAEVQSYQASVREELEKRRKSRQLNLKFKIYKI